MLCSAIYVTSCNPRKVKEELTGHVPLFFTVSVLMKFAKFTKDQNQTNKRKLRVFPVPQCHVAEQKECQGFNVPRLYHSALSLNAAVLIVLCAVESPSALSQPQIWLSGDSWLDLGWLISVETKGCRHKHTCCFLWISSTKLI